MMRLFALAFTFLSCTAAYSGGFKWPNVEYEYAQMHLMNLGAEYTENVHDAMAFQVYANGIYAKSKIGNGHQLDQEFLDKLHATMVRGVGALWHGLAKCYTPRHGIIYYNKLGEPVASFTICFECDKIDLWSINPIEKPDSDNFRESDWKLAESQITDMEALFKAEGFPLFNRPEQWNDFAKSDTLYPCMGEMFFHENKSDTLFNKPFTVGDIWLWVHKDYRAKKEFEEVNEVKFTNGGDKYIFKKFTDHKGSDFIYSADEFPTIIEATIISNKIILPNGVRVGMSLDDVQGTFMVWDGIAWPEHIQALYPAYQVDYYFEKRTLIKIELISR